MPVSMLGPAFGQNPLTDPPFFKEVKEPEGGDGKAVPEEEGGNITMNGWEKVFSSAVSCGPGYLVSW